MSTATTVDRTTDAGDYALVDLKHLKESPFNPRKAFGDMKEFTENVRTHGILQPLVVRPLAGEGKEIVFGHRRYRAAKAVGLTQVPALVRELTDAEALELQVVENCQRADIHPMEEAEAYEALHKKHGIPIDDIAAKVGKSKGHVYGRIKLLALTPTARKAFYEGAIQASVALYLARIPNVKLQEVALKEVQPDPKRYRNEALPAREAARLIQERFMLRLADAPFKTDDADLFPDAGSCSKCPKRTGNQKELFEDVKSPDLCTDPDCFKQKASIHADKVLAKAGDEGHKVVEPSKAFPHDYNDEPGNGWVDVNKAISWEEKRSWKQVLGKHLPSVSVTVDRKGRKRELLQEGVAHKAAKAAKAKIKGAQPTHRSSSSGSSDSKKWKAQEDKAAAAREIREAVEVKAMTLIVAAAQKGKIGLDYLRAIGAMAVEASGYMGAGMDLPKLFGFSSFQALTKQVEKMPEAKLRAVVLCALVSQDEDNYGGYTKSLEAAADLYGISLKKLEAEISAPAKPTVPIKVVVKKSSKPPKRHPKK